ncbi:hypothetical protein ACFLTH_03535 [Bacteroidota bacterium]
MSYYRLIHWNIEEAKKLAAKINAGKNKINFKLSTYPDFVKEISANPPLIFIISLSRLPSQGRDMALMIRQRKATRKIPILFAGGEKDKVDKIKELLPDAHYTEWININSSINKAIKSVPNDPVFHKSPFDIYEGKPLIKKLGLKANSTLTLVNSPTNFIDILGRLPENVSVKNNLKSKSDLIIWFVTDENEIIKRIKPVSIKLTETGKLWIAWPKKSSGIKTGLSQVVVRKIGLDSGLVDFKICSIDITWSALLFTTRKTK